MKIAKIMLGLVPVIGLMSVEASAAPLPRMESGAPANAAAPIEKVHGWHRYCAWGPGRYHRHVPGVGNVRCGGPRYG